MSLVQLGFILLFVILIGLLFKLLRSALKYYILIVLLGVFVFGWSKLDVIVKTEQALKTFVSVSVTAKDLVHQYVVIDNFVVKLRLGDSLIPLNDVKVVKKMGSRLGIDPIILKMNDSTYIVDVSNPVYNIITELIKGGLIKE